MPSSAVLSQSDVQQDQVWLQFLGFLNGLKSVRHFADHLWLPLFLERRTDVLTPRREVIYGKNAK